MKSWLDLYLDLWLKLLAVIVGGILLLNIVGCRTPEKQRGTLTKLMVSPTPMICQWFVDLDGDPETGYGPGYDILQRPDGLWRATFPPFFDGGWGPEIDCIESGPSLRGKLEQYTGLLDAAVYTEEFTEWRTVSCSQLADVDGDGDVDLWDAAEADCTGDLGRVVRRMTGP